MIPTVGYNVRNVRKGNITLKIWDIAGVHTICAVPIHPPRPVTLQANQNSAQPGKDIAAA